MRLRSCGQACLIVAFAALATSGALAAAIPLNGSIAALNVSAAVGSEAVRVSGSLPGAGRLQAVVYAQFSQDLPTVLLSRRPLAPDANGRFSTTLPVAPTYFAGAIITVVVQSSSGVPLARGQLALTAPNISGPADVLPPDYR